MTNPKDMKSLKGLKTLADYGVEPSDTRQLEGDHIEKDTIKGDLVLLRDWVFLTGDDGEYAIVQIETGENRDKKTFTVGSDSVMKVLKQLDREAVNKEGVGVVFDTKLSKNKRHYWVVE